MSDRRWTRLARTGCTPGSLPTGHLGARSPIACNRPFDQLRQLGSAPCGGRPAAPTASVVASLRSVIALLWRVRSVKWRTPDGAMKRQSRLDRAALAVDVAKMIGIVLGGNTVDTPGDGSSLVHLSSRHLRYFVAVAESLHFGRAAKRLYISQPALSRQIHQLEQLLGVELFDRSTRRVSLTPEGLQLIPHVQEFLARMDRTTAHIRSIGRGEENLQLAHTVSSTTRGVRALLETLGELCCSRMIVCHEYTEAKVAEAIGDGRAHIGVVHDGQRYGDLNATFFAHQPMTLLAPLDHRLAGAACVSPTDLDYETVMIPSREHSVQMHSVLIAAFRDAGSKPLLVEASVADATWSVTPNGSILALVPGFDERFAPDGVSLVDVTPELSVPQYLVWRDESWESLVSEALPLARQRLVGAGARVHSSS